MLLYLLEQHIVEQRRLADKGISLDRVYDEVVATRRACERVAETQIEHGLRLDRYGKRLRGLERWRQEQADANGSGVAHASHGSHGINTPPRQPFPSDPGEDTGIHRSLEVKLAAEMAEMRAKLAHQEEHSREKRDSIIWWKRQRWVWIAAVVLGVAMTGCTVVGSLAVWKITSAKGQKP